MPQDHSVPVYSPAFTGTHCTYPQRNGQAELTWITGYISRWFNCVRTVTDTVTNQAKCRVVMGKSIRIDSLSLIDLANYRFGLLPITILYPVLYCTVLYCPVLYCTVLYYRPTIHYTILYTILYYTSYTTYYT